MAQFNLNGYGYINSLVPGVIVARVDFDGTTYTINTPFADTNINPSLNGKSTAELLQLATGNGFFAGDDGSLFRKAGAAGTTSIKIGKVITSSVLGAHIEVVTGLTSSTRNISLGTTLNPQALIGNRPTSSLGVAGTLATNTYPTSGSFPTRGSSVSDAVVFFNPDVLVVSGTEIILTLDNTAATPITSGSIDIHIRFGSISINRRPRTNEANASFGIPKSSVIPIF